MLPPLVNPPGASVSFVPIDEMLADDRAVLSAPNARVMGC
jgi:hypothetical protein